MATNLALDDALIEKAKRVGGHKTKRDAVTAALEEYIRYRRQLRILDLFGEVQFDPAYDYKAARQSSPRDGRRRKPAERTVARRRALRGKRQ